MGDLRKLDTVTKSEEGIWIPIIAGGEKTGIEIKVKGPDSKSFKSAVNSIRKYTQKQNEKHLGEDKEEMDARSINMVSGCTVGWHDTSEEATEAGVVDGNLLVDGAQVPFSVENAITIYTSYPFILDQVAAVIMDRSSFLAD